MTTVADAIKAAIEANWNVGSGGTEPPVYNSEDYMTTSPSGDDWIMIHNRTYRRLRDRQNDTYVGERYAIEMVVSTKNDANAEERLDTMTTELYRIVTPDNVTGFNEVDIVDEDRSVSENDLKFYQAKMKIELEIYSTASAVVPGSTASSDATWDNLTVNITATLPTTTITDLANIPSASAITIKPSGDTDDYLELSTVGDAPKIKGIGGSVTLDSDGTTHILQQGNAAISIGTTIFIQKELKMQSTIDITTQANKVSDIGATGVAFDNIYADDFVNESPFLEIERSLDAIRAIQAKDGALDYESLPDWIRATKRINQVIEIDKDGNKMILDEGEKVVAEKGFSINRMCILLYQALQEATARIEALEATR